MRVLAQMTIAALAIDFICDDEADMVVWCASCLNLSGAGGSLGQTELWSFERGLGGVGDRSWRVSPRLDTKTL